MSALKKNKQQRYRQAKEAIFVEKYIGSKNTKRQRLKNTKRQRLKNTERQRL